MPALQGLEYPSKPEFNSQDFWDRPTYANTETFLVNLKEKKNGAPGKKKGFLYMTDPTAHSSSNRWFPRPCLQLKREAERDNRYGE